MHSAEVITDRNKKHWMSSIIFLVHCFSAKMRNGTEEDTHDSFQSFQHWTHKLNEREYKLGLPPGHLGQWEYL